MGADYSHHGRVLRGEAGGRNMRFLRRLVVRISNFAARRRGDECLREEMEEHLALQTEENLRAGMSAAEARRQARLKFGGAATILEDYHSEKSLPSLES